MLDWFKKRSWKPSILAEMRGVASGLAIRLIDVPCLRDEITGDKKYASPAFGHDLLLALHEAIGGAKHAHERLVAGSKVSAVVRLPQYPAIVVEMSGSPNNSLRVFESDIADALIEAFRAAGLKPT